MILLIITITLAFAYFIVLVNLYLIRLHKAHRFFREKCPHLPVLPGANIFAGHALRVISPGKNWKIIDELHKQYGPTFGYYMIEQPWVSTTDLDLIRLIEIDDAHKHQNRAFLGLPFSEFNKSLWHAENDKWRRMRRVVASALSNHTIKGSNVSADIESVVEQLAVSMERRADRSRRATGNRSSSFTLEGRNLAERYTLAVILLLTYKQSNVIDFDSERDAWVERMNGAARQLANPIVYVGMAEPVLRPLCELINQLSDVGSLQRQIVGWIKDLTTSHKQQIEHTRRHRTISSTIRSDESGFEIMNEHKRSLVDTVVNAFFERKIQYDNYEGTLLFLLLAGFMTTADTISCLLWQLAKNLDVQEKLRRAIIETGIEADYVTWCIKETIRFHPALPLGTGRVLGEDVTVNGQFLAKGTFVMPSTHSIHHDPSIWPEPERFNPDRWRHQANFHPAAFLGFGLGPRNCAGRKLAIHEIKLVLSMLLTHYRIEPCQATPQEWLFSSPAMVYTLNDAPIELRFTPLKESLAVAA